MSTVILAVAAGGNFFDFSRREVLLPDLKLARYVAGIGRRAILWEVPGGDDPYRLVFKTVNEAIVRSCEAATMKLPAAITPTRVVVGNYPDLREGFSLVALNNSGGIAGYVTALLLNGVIVSRRKGIVDGDWPLSFRSEPEARQVVKQYANSLKLA